MGDEELFIYKNNFKMYYKLSDYAKKHNVTYRTAWNRFKKGLIDGAFMDEHGHIKIPVLSLDKLNNAIIYCRVSNNDAKDNLNRQADRLTDYTIRNGYNIIDIVKEIASGLNDNRKKLTDILKRDDWDLLIVENKDRLTRFGFNYIKTLLNSKGKDVIIVNQSDDDNTDLIQDLVSIIYSFSARLYGLRKKKSKKEIIDFIEN